MPKATTSSVVCEDNHHRPGDTKVLFAALFDQAKVSEQATLMSIVRLSPNEFVAEYRNEK